MSRPPPTAQRLGTSLGRPPGTASRLSTARQQLGTAQRAGGGIALSQQINVSDRPTTQQGLGGMKTGMAGSQRVVQDRTYFLGVLRSKLNEIVSETRKINADVQHLKTENASFLNYEKKAEKLALELREYQGEMADYNILVEKLATDSDLSDVKDDLADFTAGNEREARQLETLFEKKQEQEKVVHQLETELKQERRMTDTLLDNMNPAQRSEYERLSTENTRLASTLESCQAELDKLQTQKQELEQKLTGSAVRQEAVRLLEDLEDLKQRLEKAEKEERERGSPEQQREKLLAQVKNDNAELAAMESQQTEMLEKLEQMRDESSQLEIDIREGQSEKNQKYKELKRREMQMDEFLSGFEAAKSGDVTRIHQLEEKIVFLLDQSSRNLGHLGQMPTASNLRELKHNLNMKEGEMVKSEDTAGTLTTDERKLRADLAKVEQLETKVTDELAELREKITTMAGEMDTLGDIEKLRRDADTRRQRLSEDRVVLRKRHDVMQQHVKQIAGEYEASKAQLEEQDAYTQLRHLEQQWQQKESNNFALREFIAAKGSESDYRQVVDKVKESVSNYNRSLQKAL